MRDFLTKDRGGSLIWDDKSLWCDWTVALENNIHFVARGYPIMWQWIATEHSAFFFCLSVLQTDTVVWTAVTFLHIKSLEVEEHSLSSKAHQFVVMSFTVNCLKGLIWRMQSICCIVRCKCQHLTNTVSFIFPQMKKIHVSMLLKKMLCSLVIWFDPA